MLSRAFSLVKYCSEVYYPRANGFAADLRNQRPGTQVFDDLNHNMSFQQKGRVLHS
jgi:hypothetical protein